MVKKSFFLDFFPPPKYLAMPAVGFDISDRSIKYVELRRKNGTVVAYRFGQHALPAGIIENGDIKQKDKLIDFLKSIKKEIKSDYLIVSLPEEKAYLANLKIPVMENREVRGALELQLEEHIPLLPNETIFDFNILGKTADGSQLMVSVIAFPRILVESYRDVFIEAGFSLVGLEMEILASARAIIPESERGAVMFIDFGRTRISFAIVNNGALQFTSTIKVGGEELEKVLIKNLQVDQFQAEKLKKECGFVKGKENEKVFNALLPVISVIKDEIGKRIIYWNTHLGEYDAQKISKVFLCGGDSNLTGLPEYLSYELKLPVELGNPWVNTISFSERVPEIELKDALIYATAFGLALNAYCLK